MFFSVELDCELLIWEKAFQTATFLEVERIQVHSTGEGLGTEAFGSCSLPCHILSCPVLQCKTYACIMESHLMGLTVDFSMGFVCFDAASKVGVRRSSVLNGQTSQKPMAHGVPRILCLPDSAPCAFWECSFQTFQSCLQIVLAAAQVRAHSSNSARYWKEQDASAAILF